jgi:hypothetical protein
LLRLAIRGDSLLSGTVVHRTDVFETDPVTGRVVPKPSFRASAVRVACATG